MIKDRKEWNSLFKETKATIAHPEGHMESVIENTLLLHSFCHESPGALEESLEDQFWSKNSNLLFCSEKNIYSGAWHLWHSARIEDICTSHFLDHSQEVYEDFKAMSSVSFRHTGNSLNISQMKDFNNSIDLEELRSYRRAVGVKTQSCMEKLTSQQLKSKVRPQDLNEIERLGSVATEDLWFLDFWGKKKISGIVCMPLSRHLLVHLNGAIRAAKISN